MLFRHMHKDPPKLVLLGMDLVRLPKQQDLPQLLGWAWGLQHSVGQDFPPQDLGPVLSPGPGAFPGACVALEGH